MQLQAIATTRAGNFKFTYTRAGNLHTRVLANAIANFPIHGKSIFTCYCIFTTRKNYSIYAVSGALIRFNFVNIFLHHPLVLNIFPRLLQESSKIVKTN